MKIKINVNYIMRIKIISLILLILIGLGGCKQVSYTTTQKNSVPLNIKTYTNEQLGITFQYPSNWITKDKENEILDLSGTIATIEINFMDTLLKTNLLVIYHLAPNGIKQYNFAVSQFNSSQGWYVKDGRQMEIDGINAIVATMTSDLDGKGYKLNPPIKTMIVDMLDKKQKGEFELQFKTPVPNENIEVPKFKQLLSTFKFIN